MANKHLNPESADKPTRPETHAGSRHVVVTVHGIRTAGQWQERLTRLLEQAEPDVEVLNYKYGYFSVLAFIVPITRWIVTLRFRRALESVIRRNPDAKVDLVGHSFGTHLVGHSLRGLVRRAVPVRVDTVLLAGSVLKPDFPWRDLIDRGYVRHLVNECGILDRILIINQLAVLGTGMAGRVGFNGVLDRRLLNRYYRFGHSGYFQREGGLYDEFLAGRWLPLLTGPAPAEPHDERSVGGFVQGFVTFALNNSEPIKLLAYSVLLLGTLVITAGGWYLSDERNRELVQANREIKAKKLILERKQNALNLANIDLSRKGDEIADRLYISDMQLVAGALQTGDLQRAKALLGRHIPKDPGDIDRRRLEWYLHWRKAYAERMSFRLPGGVTSMALTSDGKVLAAATDSHRLRLYDTITGRATDVPLANGTEHIPIDPILFTPDDRTMIVLDGWSARLYAVPSGELRKQLGGQGYNLETESSELGDSGPGYLVQWQRMTPDGKTLATCDRDGTVVLWDISTARMRRVFPKCAARGYAIAPMAFLDNRTLATVGDEPAPGSIRIWDVETGAQQPPLDGATQATDGLLASPNGRWLATCRIDGVVELWNVRAGKRVSTLDTAHDELITMGFSPESDYLVTLHPAEARLWYLSGEMTALMRPSTTLEVVADQFDFIKSGTLVTTKRPRRTDRGHWAGDVDECTVRFWNMGIGQLVDNLEAVRGSVSRFAFSADGKVLATGGDPSRDRGAAKSELRLWNVPRLLGDYQVVVAEGDVIDLAYDPQGRTLATASGSPANTHEGMAELWDAATGVKLSTLPGTRLDFRRASFASDGTTLATSGGDGGVRLWDVRRGCELASPLAKAGGEVKLTMSLSPDGRTIAIVTPAEAPYRKAIQLWDASDDAKKPRALLEADGASDAFLMFLPDGKTLASSPGGPHVRLWGIDAGTANLQSTLVGHASEGFITLACSPDSRWLARGSTDGVIELLDLTTRTERSVLWGHGMPGYTSLAFSPDGRTLASSCGPELRLWDIGTGSERARMSGGADRLAFSPDGMTLAAASDRRVSLLRGSSIAEVESDQARELVKSLYEHYMIEDDVRDAILADSTLTERGRELALALARNMDRNDPEALNEASWEVVRASGQSLAEYRRALRRAEVACRIANDVPVYRLTLIMAYYRAGRFEAARTALEQADRLGAATGDYKSKLALACASIAAHRLGDIDLSRACLDRAVEDVTEARRREYLHDLLRDIGSPEFAPVADQLLPETGQ